MSRLRHITANELYNSAVEDWPSIPGECQGYSGCNCSHCGCECGKCFKCNPRAYLPMSAEQTLLTHWKACVESRDSACIAAFTDHLMELWGDAVREDADYTRETGGNVPILRLEHLGRTLKIDYTDPKFDPDGWPVSTGRVDIILSVYQNVLRWQGRRTMRNYDPPSVWGYDDAATFTSIITEFLSRFTDGHHPVLGANNED